MNVEKSRILAKNAYRFGFVLVAYTIAESLWHVSGYGSRGLAMGGALVCFVGIALDLYVTFDGESRRP